MLLVDRIDAALPQTQCTRCGFPDCRAYAQAVASGKAAINQCPPGGDEGIRRLAQLTGQATTASQTPRAVVAKASQTAAPTAAKPTRRRSA
jgi:RnfABCDGE-type electron transport complex B subunit